MPNDDWIPEIMYEEPSQEEGLSSNIPFIPVPNDQEMPKLLYVFESRETGEFEPGPEGEDLPESLPIFEPLLFSGSDKDISIDLLNPIPDEISEEASIIILTLYNPEGAIDLDNIRLMIDDEDVSEFIYKSIDMVTFVPNEPLPSGKHEIEFQLVDDEGVYLKKKFKFNKNILG